MAAVKHKNSWKDYERAKELRQQSPMAEQRLWNILQQLKKETGWKFRRQQPLHPYIVDFACMTSRLVIELDGSSHDASCSYDEKRTSDLNAMGWTVIRFSNNDVQENLRGVATSIMEKIKELSRQS